MKKISAIIILLFLATGSFTEIYAKTTITVVQESGATDINLDEMANQQDDLIKKFGPGIANAFSLGNMVGYPVGKSYIGALPSFEVGMAFNAGATNLKYLNGETEQIPAGGPNLALHFGLGIIKGWDVIGKIFYFDYDYFAKWLPGVDYGILKLDSLKLYSMGGRVRKQLIGDITVLPFIFSFGGLTLSFGADFMYGKIGLSGKYNANFTEITVDPDGAGGVAAENMKIAFDSTYGMKVSWGLFSVSSQIVTYFDLFYLFSFYTGFHLAASYGSFDLGFDGTGNLTTDNATYIATVGSNRVGVLTADSSNSFNPDVLLPGWIFGLELNIWKIKVTGETMVNLRNREDITGSLGLRFQF